MPRENTIVGACTRELDRRGAWWVNVHGAGVGRNGIPDLIFNYLGYAGAIENKTRRGRVAKLQAYELERFAAAGGYTLVCRRVAQLVELLNEIERVDQHREQLEHAQRGDAC